MINNVKTQENILWHLLLDFVQSPMSLISSGDTQEQNALLYDVCHRTDKITKLLHDPEIVTFPWVKTSKDGRWY